jgi:hypothetical protein
VRMFVGKYSYLKGEVAGCMLGSVQYLFSLGYYFWEIVFPPVHLLSCVKVLCTVQYVTNFYL